MGYNMTDHTSASLDELPATVERLQQLIARLHEANLRFSKAAEPLARLPELNGEQRTKLGAQIRAANGEWEEITRLIDREIAP
jgi:transposase